MPPMNSSRQILDQQFIEMRSRCLSLAADIDRIQRAEGGDEGGDEVRSGDPRLQMLREGLAILLEDCPGRAARVLEAFSDRTTAPAK